MNKYLEKIAESLPYRKRVEVIIRKGDNILLTINKNKDTGDEWYGFPGGGLDGKSELETAKEECLEEVGIAISNPKKLEVGTYTEEGMSTKDNRHLKFRGSITTWYEADYDSMDKSQLGEDGDSRKYRWRPLSEALGDVKGDRGIATHRVKAMKALKPVKLVLDKKANFELQFVPDLTPEQMKILEVLASQYYGKDPKTSNYFKVDASLKH